MRPLHHVWIEEIRLPITVACSLILKTVAALLLAVLPVTVKTNGGKIVEGNLDGFTPSSLLLNQTDEVVEYGFDELMSLRPEDVEEKIGPDFVVSLVGGSRIAAQDLSLDGTELLIEPRRQDQLRVPIKQVKSIRFRGSSKSTDAQWLGIVDRESRGDTLVIRRPGDRLDPQQGVVASIEDGKVAFDLDGVTINAPIDRLEGVVFGGTQAVIEDADIQVTDIYGSRWSVIAIEPSKGDQPLQMRLLTSVLFQLPLHQIESIRWTGGVSMLAVEKPASKSFYAYLQTEVDENLMLDLFGPTADGEADLVMVGGSSIVYRIEPGYRVFAGTVRRQPNVSNGGKVTVRIEMDGETVWQEQIADAEPLGFELPVEEARRLAIKIDSGDDGDLGDTIRISRPRLLK